MIRFGCDTFWNRLKYRLIPSYRCKRDVETKAGIKWLIDHPEVPCLVGNTLIPNGYGNQDSLSKQLFGVELF
jgi:hypothetical protein